MASALLGLVLLAPYFEQERGSSQAHISQYFQEAGYIDQVLGQHGPGEAIGMTEILGGVAPHHIPTSIPLLADFYLRLRASRQVGTFIVLGPDHFERGRGDVSISREKFRTPFGILSPDLSMINKLEAAGLAVHDETPFGDHSIHSQLLFIAKLFPNAKVVPIVFRSSSTNEFAEVLGQRLAEMAGPDTFIVASVDFSHYLNQGQARPLDERSAAALGRMDPRLAGLVEADSPQSLVAIIAAVKKLGADSNKDLGTYNSGDYSNIRDFTTGYVLQFFGIK